ncbi:30S ribosomal protein S1 [Paraliomyxa miuraensis]|uniref:30S ribosomal protein S1 n=1 Tax=Paraliomyxa miuraensis TaxID=376150 RepID=UPI00224E4AFB|nr:S1 RNA-binding domain-containing protein [Paraliomyxa miuraensis]MCX4243231.1 S1 RNA-binding domain-containing protein [Paraliomyxa miuraensis]
MAENDDDFATLFEQSMATGAAAAPRARNAQLKAGQVVEGTVVAIGDDTVFVDVGTKAEARLDRSAVTDDRGELKVRVGDRLKATVADPGGRQAPRLVLAYGAGGLDVEALELAAQSGTPVEGEIRKAVKAGLEVDVGGVRAFCPASQVELSYVADLEAFVGQRHFFRVLEVRDGGRSVVVSRKALLLAERDQKASELAERLEVGAELDGIVQSIQPYGAFVDLGGLQGLVHVSEMAHGRVSSPSDMVSVGESVRVKITAIDAAASGKVQDMRISLSMKALVQPTEGTSPASGGDEVVTATVVKVEGFGILVDTPAGQGLVPNGELALPPGSDPRRAFSPGDALDVVLLRRDGGTGRLRFSAKAVEEVEARRNFRQFREDQGKSGKGLGSLGDLAGMLAGIDLPDAPQPAKAPPPGSGGAAKGPVPSGAAKAPAPSGAAKAPAPSERAPGKGRRRRV